ncbi:MAG: hypothetical protein OHK006_20900 [Thermodesulfovibrionales bacterium]
MPSNESASKRAFPRRRFDVDVRLTIGGEHFDGRLIDLSVNGLGVFLFEETSLDSRQIQVSVSNLSVDAAGRVVWSKRVSSGQQLGIALSGRIMGRLDIWTLPDVLQGLHKRGETGTLKIVDSTGTRKIYLQDGEIVFASSGKDDEQIGRLFLATGRITQSQLDQARNAAEKTGRAIGALLVELGAVSSADLIWAVQNQAEQNIAHVMTLGQGAFVFADGPLPREEIVRLPLNTPEILYRTVRTSSDPERIRHCFTENDIVIRADNDAVIAASLPLNRQDRDVLGLFGSSERVSRILERSALDEGETFRILYALMSVGIIDVRGMVSEDGTESGGKASAAQETAPQPDPKEVELRNRIEYLFQHHRALGYYGILEVDHHATPEEIKKAYHRMVRAYHPDRHHHFASQDLKFKLNSVFAYINEAYTFLSRTASGGKAQETAAPAPPQPANEMERNRRMAMAKFEAGTLYFRKGNYSEASTLFGQAIYLNSQVADYHYFYGASLRQMKKFKDAEESIKKALQLSPFNADYVTALGEIYLQLGFRTRARHAFEKALKFDPANAEANEGLRRCEQ